MSVGYGSREAIVEVPISEWQALNVVIDSLRAELAEAVRLIRASYDANGRYIVTDSTEDRIAAQAAHEAVVMFLAKHPAP